MTEWKEVKDSREEAPAVIDTETSSLKVYERRNIRRETEERETSDGEPETVSYWAYEQREYTAEEYAAVTSPATRAIMQSLSEIELSIAEL